MKWDDSKDDDLIRRGDLKKEYLKYSFFPALISNVLQKAPAVDASEVKHGRWIFDAGVDYCYKCSECQGMKPPHYIGEKFCPNCGAKMDGEREDI